MSASANPDGRTAIAAAQREHVPSVPKHVFGAGAIEKLPALAVELGFRRTLLVADDGLIEVGHVDRAVDLLQSAGVETQVFHDFGSNPDTRMIEAGRTVAVERGIDSLVGLGGGSSMDCAKGINFLVSNGGRVQDYWGWGKARKPMLPMIGIPTTTGTGSEAQSYAIISDAKTHVKMACGDRQAAFRYAILDPQLAVSQPREVRAISGYDAIAHTVETYVTTQRNETSDEHALEAWNHLNGSFEIYLDQLDDLEAVGEMQLGAWHAGCAIEHSMLGAAHACANPLTARHDIAHGIAVGLMLAHVVRWNAEVVNGRYAEFHPDLPTRLDELAVAAKLPRRLRDVGIARDELAELAEAASGQWTGRFNPRPFDAETALEVYRCAW